jgi:cytochrome P450
MADTGTAAALAANFEFSDERVRAANRDEAMFPDAATFDIDRPNANRQMAFSSGIHLCQGAGLARLEMQVVLEEVLGTIPDYVVDADSIEFRGIQGVHSVKSMPVTFTPVPAGLSASVWRRP